MKQILIIILAAAICLPMVGCMSFGGKNSPEVIKRGQNGEIIKTENIRGLIYREKKPDTKVPNGVKLPVPQKVTSRDLPEEKAQIKAAPVENKPDEIQEHSLTVEVEGTRQKAPEITNETKESFFKRAGLYLVAWVLFLAACFFIYRLVESLIYPTRRGVIENQKNPFSARAEKDGCVQLELPLFKEQTPSR